MSPVTARVFESLTELLDPGGRLRESLKMATEIVGVSISAATGCSQTNYFLLIHLFSSEQLQQIELQEGQASTKRYHTCAQIFLSNQRVTAGQVQVIREGTLHPLVHSVP